jgi:hypothetical protein
MIRFGCPACEQVMSAPIKQTGKVIPCPSCGQKVQVPPPDEAAYEEEDLRRVRRQREGMRAFLSLIRLFLWGICFAGILTAVIGYYLELQRKQGYQERTEFAIVYTVFIIGSYFVARTFDLMTRSLEDLCTRFRRRR